MALHSRFMASIMGPWMPGSPLNLPAVRCPRWGQGSPSGVGPGPRRLCGRRCYHTAEPGCPGRRHPSPRTVRTGRLHAAVSLVDLPIVAALVGYGRSAGQGLNAVPWRLTPCVVRPASRFPPPSGAGAFVQFQNSTGVCRSPPRHPALPHGRTQHRKSLLRGRSVELRI